MEQKRARGNESQLEIPQSPKQVRTSSAIENISPNSKASEPKERPKSPTVKKSKLIAPDLSGVADIAPESPAVGANTSSTAKMSLAFQRSAARLARQQPTKPYIGPRARLKGARTPSPVKKPPANYDDEFSPERTVHWDFDAQRQKDLEQLIQARTEELSLSLRETLMGCKKSNADLAQAISAIIASSMALLPKNIEHSFITEDLLGVLSGASLQQLLKVANLHHQVLLSLEERLLSAEIIGISSDELLDIREDALNSIKMDINTAAKYKNLLSGVIDSYQRDMQVFCNYYHLEQPSSEAEIITSLAQYLGFTTEFLEKRPTLVRMLIEQTSSYSSMFSHERICHHPKTNQIRESLLTDVRLYEQEEFERQQPEEEQSLARVFC